MNVSLAQQANFLVRQMLSDARHLEASDCWVRFGSRPTSEELVGTDLQFFMLWLFAVDAISILGSNMAPPPANRPIIPPISPSHRDRHFGNGRTERNAFERTLTGQANRLASMPHPTRDDPLQLMAEDFGVPMS